MRQPNILTYKDMHTGGNPYTLVKPFAVKLDNLCDVEFNMSLCCIKSNPFKLSVSLELNAYG